MNKTLLIGEALNKEADPCQQVSVNASIERSRDPLPHDRNRFSLASSPGPSPASALGAHSLVEGPGDEARFSRSFASRAIRNDSHEQKASSRWH